MACLNNLNLRLSLFFLLSCVIVGIVSAQLSPSFYATSCPTALATIGASVLDAVTADGRMGASLLRLHYLDCFVQGCDASILLDGLGAEKSAFPIAESARGFDVIDNIKSLLESECPGVVSCADIVAVAARDSVAALGGPTWVVPLGRRDSTTSFASAVISNLPSPYSDLNGLINAFAIKGLSTRDMVALSGAHTIGKARCATFRTRIYNETNIDPTYAQKLQASCPFVGGDDNLSDLDAFSPNFFDMAYFGNLKNKRGLLHSDQQLFNGGSTDAIVNFYSTNPLAFSVDFVNAMLKMGTIGVLTGSNGQIRTDCTNVN